MPTIYVVMGTSGEYSDRQEWPVCAYRSEDAAQAAVIRLSEHARRYEEARRAAGDDYYEREADMLAAHREASGDPNFDWDYTGVRYYPMSVWLEE